MENCRVRGGKESVAKGNEEECTGRKLQPKLQVVLRLWVPVRPLPRQPHADRHHPLLSSQHHLHRVEPVRGELSTAGGYLPREQLPNVVPIHDSIRTARTAAPAGAATAGSRRRRMGRGTAWGWRGRAPRRQRTRRTRGRSWSWPWGLGGCAPPHRRRGRPPPPCRRCRATSASSSRGRGSPPRTAPRDAS